MKKHEKLELDFLHPSIMLERQILFHIEQGDYETSLNILEKINKPSRTHLADDPIRSLQNSIIISISLFTRSVLNAGVHYEEAFDETDKFIRLISKLEDETELILLEKSILKLFCDKVKTYLKNTGHSYHISRVKAYVSKNINKKIKSKDISLELSLNQTYLSRIFKQEMDMTLSEYITHEKIKIAKELIEFSNLSFSDISLLLNFTDQSHFTRKFKQVTSMTPRQYLQGVDKTNLKSKKS